VQFIFVEEEAVKNSTAVQRTNAPSHLRLVPAEQMFDHMKETFDAITRRAFEIFANNGRQVGRELDDWLQAETEFLHPTHLDISESDTMLTIRAEVPGFNEKDIEVSVEPRRVTISGKRESGTERKKGKATYSERCANQFFRAADLPAEVDATSSVVNATYDQGVLTITLPKIGAVKPRQIKVQPKAS
jgi:HSP20 family protein